jgi:hypothetical protein
MEYFSLVFASFLFIVGLIYFVRNIFIEFLMYVFMGLFCFIAYLFVFGSPLPLYTFLTNTHSYEVTYLHLVRSESGKKHIRFIGRNVNKTRVLYFEIPWSEESFKSLTDAAKRAKEGTRNGTFIFKFNKQGKIGESDITMVQELPTIRKD